MILENQRFKNTDDFLKLLAYRLSGRDDLKSTTYKVHIAENDQITMDPLIFVYPNRYRRKEADRMDIVSFILSTFVRKQDRIFVPGDYIYQPCGNSKRRRWVKVEGGN